MGEHCTVEELLPTLTLEECRSLLNYSFKHRSYNAGYTVQCNQPFKTHHAYIDDGRLRNIVIEIQDKEEPAFYHRYWISDTIFLKWARRKRRDG